MSNLPLLVLGTHNAKKEKELVGLLTPLAINIRTLSDYPQALHVDEDGNTFEENAEKKACSQAAHLGCWVLGEDSGLCVDALGGDPGIFSARFAGEQADDAQNNVLLLKQMQDVKDKNRHAHYVCHIVIADPTGTVRASSMGKCRGLIRHQAAGSNGFGYDPLFEIREYHRTFGELAGALKRAISHRARAISRLLPQLQRLLCEEAWPPE